LRPWFVAGHLDVESGRICCGKSDEMGKRCEWVS
jgi:hypothetical protein